MRKLLRLPVGALVFLITLLLAVTALAADAGDDYDYTVEDGTVVLEAYTGNAQDVVIPSEVGGKPVTTIGYMCFYGVDSIKTIAIPASVTTIEDAAFADCANLTTLTVDAASHSFSSEDGVLYDKAKMNLMTYPTAKGGAFVVPATVTVIGDGAFSASTVETVTLPANLKVIGMAAFDLCKSLKTITIPAKVTSVGLYAFAECPKLTAINVASANTTYSSKDGVLYNKNRTALVSCPGGKSTVTVPSGVKTIKEVAFYGSTLRSVSLPNTLTTIGDSAFSACENLEHITLPKKVTTVGNGAFMYCPSLTTVTLSDSLTSIGMMSFSLCESLKTITIPAKVTSVGMGAFMMCDNLESIYFLGKLPSIDVTAYESEKIPVFYYRVSNASGWKNYTAHLAKPFSIVSQCVVGSKVAAQYYAPINSDKHIETPTALTRKGYTFAGWYKDPARKTKWDFATAKITGDIKAYAAWKMTSKTVPDNVEAKSTGYDGIKLSWNKVDGAKKYRVYRASSKSGTYSQVKETSSTNFTDTGRKTGKTYYYKIKAINGSTKSQYSATISAKAVPAKASGIKAKALNSTSVKVSWGKVSGATGYQVYRATSKDGDYTKVKATSAASYTDKKLTDNKTYYYKVIAYRTVGGEKVYGAFSAVVSAKP